jgi:hypothetical protein
MKTCLIPPIPHLATAAEDEHHLLLSHLIEDDRYRSFYADCATRGHFITLDNSAHERGHGESFMVLLQQAAQVGAREIVIPDVLFDSKQSTFQAVRTLQQYLEDQDDPPFRVMLVAQGKKKADWAHCLNAQVSFAALCMEQCPNLEVTLGLSKDYEIFDGGLFMLVRDFYYHAKRVLGCQIHLLGWGRQMWELRRVADTYGDIIRTVDSAKPFVFASAGIRLTPNRMAEYPRRPENYFNLVLTDEQVEIAEHNIRCFEWAAGETDDY